MLVELLLAIWLLLLTREGHECVGVLLGHLGICHEGVGLLLLSSLHRIHVTEGVLATHHHLLLLLLLHHHILSLRLELLRHHCHHLILHLSLLLYFVTHWVRNEGWLLLLICSGWGCRLQR